MARLQEHGVARADRDPLDLAEVLCAYEGGVLMSEVCGNNRPLRLALDTTLAATLV